MTKIILHGGFTGADNELNRGYYREMTKGLADGSKILEVFFARKEEEWEELFEQEKERTSRAAPNTQFEFILASENNFIDQVKGADLISFRGGEIAKLMNILKHYPEFGDAIKGRVLVGGSAGAYIFSKYYHSASHGDISEGLGILPIRIICHFGSDRFKVAEDAISKMNKYPQELELVVLKDFEWRVFEK